MLLCLFYFHIVEFLWHIDFMLLIISHILKKKCYLSTLAFLDTNQRYAQPNVTGPQITKTCHYFLSLFLSMFHVNNFHCFSGLFNLFFRVYYAINHTQWIFSSVHLFVIALLSFSWYTRNCIYLMCEIWWIWTCRQHDTNTTIN